MMNPRILQVQGKSLLDMSGFPVQRSDASAAVDSLKDRGQRGPSESNRFRRPSCIGKGLSHPPSWNELCFRFLGEGRGVTR